MKVFLTHKVLFKDLSLDAFFGANCDMSCYIFCPIATRPSDMELAMKQSDFLSVFQNKLVYLTGDLFKNLKLC